MKSSKQVCEVLATEYDRLTNEGEVYGAWLRLAEIVHRCTFESVDRNEPRLRWALDEPISTSILETLRNRANAEVNRIQRMLSAPGSYEVEEIVLVLTSRLQLELLARYMARRSLSLGDCGLNEVDLDIRSAFQSTDNRAKYQTALALLERNWSLGIELPW